MIKLIETARKNSLMAKRTKGQRAKQRKSKSMEKTHTWTSRDKKGSNSDIDKKADR